MWNSLIETSRVRGSLLQKGVLFVITGGREKQYKSNYVCLNENALSFNWQLWSCTSRGLQQYYFSSFDAWAYTLYILLFPPPLASHLHFLIFIQKKKFTNKWGKFQKIWSLYLKKNYFFPPKQKWSFLICRLRKF